MILRHALARRGSVYVVEIRDRHQPAEKIVRKIRKNFKVNQKQSLELFAEHSTFGLFGLVAPQTPMAFLSKARLSGRHRFRRDRAGQDRTED